MIFTVSIRIALFIGALLLFKLGGRGFLAILFAFSSDMPRALALATLGWMIGYLYLSIIAMGLAFKLNWIKTKFILISSCAGLLVSVSHLYKMGCSSTNLREDTFLFLNCTAHPIEWFGIVVSVLLIAVCVIRLNNFNLSSNAM